MLQKGIDSREVSKKRGENQERNLPRGQCICTDFRTGNDPFVWNTTETILLCDLEEIKEDEITYY